MGLLDKVEKGEAAGKKQKEEKDTKNDTEKFDVDKIRKHVEQQIKKQETKNIEEPKVVFANNKIVVLRPEGSLDLIKEQASEQKPKGPIDFAKLKLEIESELKGKSRTEKPKQSEDRVQTGIFGLDDVMGGGFRKNTVSLVIGGPGSGKTIFCMQFLVNGIDMFNENGVYISFEQTEEEILYDMAQFNWGLENKIKNKKLAILTYTPEQVEKVLAAGGGTVRDAIDGIKARRIVFDSLTAFTLLHENALAQRKACVSLFASMKKWDCTGLMISEHEGNPELHKPTVEEFEVDGVISIYNIRRGDVRERAIEVFKLRGTKHSAKIFPMIVNENGIAVYPDQTVF